MVSSWKAAETGTVQVPRSRDGSVRAARPLVICSLGDPKTLRSRRLIRIDPDQRPFVLARRVAKRLDRCGDYLISIGIRGAKT